MQPTKRTEHGNKASSAAGMRAQHATSVLWEQAEQQEWRDGYTSAGIVVWDFTSTSKTKAADPKLTCTHAFRLQGSGCSSAVKQCPEMEHQA
jgi:hypothetical protein